LPHQLNPLIRVNQRRLYDLLFQTAAQTLQEFARDPQHLGAEIGITAVLHTWGQTLTEHIHVHWVVTGGGLSPAGTQWRACQRRFLFAVKALGAVFRGKYLAGLERLRSQQRLTFAGASAVWVEEDTWNSLRQQLFAKPWVVYAKPPWGSLILIHKIAQVVWGEQVLWNKERPWKRAGHELRWRAWQSGISAVGAVWSEFANRC